MPISFSLPRAATGVALVAASLAGCFGSVAEVKRRHFLLEGAPQGQNPGPSHDMATALPAQGTLWVKDFQVHAIYDRAQLVHRLSPQEVRFSRDEVWAARAGRMLADAVARHWLLHTPFLAVSRSAGELQAPYTLSGEITALEVVEPSGLGDSAVAHLAWVLQLVDTSSGKTLGQYVFDDTLALQTSGSGGGQVAAALDTLVGQATAKAAQDVRRDLSPAASTAQALP